MTGHLRDDGMEKMMVIQMDLTWVKMMAAMTAERMAHVTVEMTAEMRVVLKAPKTADYWVEMRVGSMVPTTACTKAEPTAH
jgi:hypothetical protein